MNRQEIKKLIQEEIQTVLKELGPPGEPVIGIDKYLELWQEHEAKITPIRQKFKDFAQRYSIHNIPIANLFDENGEWNKEAAEIIKLMDELENKITKIEKQKKPEHSWEKSIPLKTSPGW